MHVHYPNSYKACLVEEEAVWVCLIPHKVKAQAARLLARALDVILHDFCGAATHSEGWQPLQRFCHSRWVSKRFFS